MTRPRKAKVRYCVFCSPKFAVVREKKQYSAKPPSSSHDGVKCTKCGRFACDNCLNKLMSVIPKRHWDNWCRQISSYLKTRRVPDNFAGHCCELQVTKHSPNVSKKPSESPVVPLCDGDLFLVEFGLLIQTSFTSVDIHSLSNDASTLRSGAWHSTVSMKLALSFQEMKIFPRQFSMQTAKKALVKIFVPWDEKCIEYVSTM